MPSAHTIDLKLSKQSQELLDRLEKYAGFVSVLASMKVIGISYRKEVKAIFERKQVRKPSLKWEKLDPIYKKIKDKKYPGKGILEATGTLKKSMTVSGAFGNISKTTHKSGSFGSSVSYGDYHDNTTKPRKTLPLRNFSLPSESTYGSWLNTIESDLSAQLERIGIVVT